MKKLILLVALLTLAVFVSGVMAQAPAKPAGTAAPAPAALAPEKPMKMEKFSGTIEKVDEAAKMIEVKSKKTMSFAIDDQTKITKAGKEMSFANVKKGMHVSVEYKKEGDKMIATAIKASAPKAAKKEKPAT